MTLHVIPFPHDADFYAPIADRLYYGCTGGQHIIPLPHDADFYAPIADRLYYGCTGGRAVSVQFFVRTITLLFHVRLTLNLASLLVATVRSAVH